MKRGYEAAVRGSHKKHAHKFIMARTAGSAAFVGVVLSVLVTVGLIATL